MNERFDKLVPGKATKAALAIDAGMIMFALFVATGQLGTIAGSWVLAASVCAVLSWFLVIALISSRLSSSSLLVMALVAGAAAFRLVFAQHLFLLTLLTLFSWFVAISVLRLYSPCTPRRLLEELILGVLSSLGVTASVAAGYYLLGYEVPIDFSLFFGLVFATTTSSRLAILRPLSPYLNDSPPSRCSSWAPGAWGSRPSIASQAIPSRPARSLDS
jgi:hypothetical protein